MSIHYRILFLCEEKRQPSRVSNFQFTDSLFELRKIDYVFRLTLNRQKTFLGFHLTICSYNDYN